MKKRIFLAILIVLTLTFIFSNSLESSEASSLRSLSVLRFLERIFGEGRITHHFVRKLAHFCEFGLLGLEFSLFFRTFEKDKTLCCLFCGLLSALCDETLQLFSNRGSQVQDVWLDYGGYCCGVLFIMALFIVLKKKKV